MLLASLYWLTVTDGSQSASGTSSIGIVQSVPFQSYSARGVFPKPHTAQHTCRRASMMRPTSSSAPSQSPDKVPACRSYSCCCKGSKCCSTTAAALACTPACQHTTRQVKQDQLVRLTSAHCVSAGGCVSITHCFSLLLYRQAAVSTATAAATDLAAAPGCHTTACHDPCHLVTTVQLQVTCACSR